MTDLPDALIPVSEEKYTTLPLSEMLHLAWATRGMTREQVETISYMPLYEDRAKALEAENAAMREALTGIVGHSDGWSDMQYATLRAKMDIINCNARALVAKYPESHDGTDAAEEAEDEN